MAGGGGGGALWAIAPLPRFRKLLIDALEYDESFCKFAPKYRPLMLDIFVQLNHVVTVSRKFCPSANISTNHRRAVVYVIGQKAFQHIICPQCASTKSNGLD